MDGGRLDKWSGETMCRSLENTRRGRKTIGGMDGVSDVEKNALRCHPGAAGSREGGGYRVRLKGVPRSADATKRLGIMAKGRMRMGFFPCVRASH